MKSFHYLFNVITIGDPAVGKSSIMLQFLDQKFKFEHDVTIGVQFGSKTLEVEDTTIKLQIWDTARQESFKSITRSYYRGSVGAVLLYDITRRNTFQHLKGWLDEIRLHGNSNMEVIVVGNKDDLEQNRMVGMEEGEKFAEQNNLAFIEINTRDYSKCESVFKILAETILQKIKSEKISMQAQNSGVIIGELSKKVEKKERKCC